jgi:outer membrane biosynthesis protein TonB
MTNEFDKQRHKKAFIYTAAICSLLLLAFIFISWKVKPTAPPVIADRIEINLGDNNEGFGEEEPEAIGAPAPEEEKTAPTPPVEEEAAEAPKENIEPDENAEEVAAPVVKPIAKVTPKLTPVVKSVVKPIAKPTTVAKANPTPTAKPAPAQKPKFTMPGATGPGGNNATKNNDTYQQGNNKNGNGNKGVPGGNPDTYGTKPGGSISPATVTKGKRKIISVRPYKFPGDLERATIFADIKVSPDGSGSFLRIAQGSTSTSSAYANAIRGYLQNIKFDAADDDGVVTVRFNFNVD